MALIRNASQSNEILRLISNNLDITKTQYEMAVRSYQAVGEWLSKEDSLLYNYQPEILPQGSFLLGTMIRPIKDTDELDVDLVCKLKGKNPTWTQFDIKRIVGQRLREHKTYKDLLEKEKRRCWTLNYKADPYHMDILPSIVSEGYTYVLEKAFSSIDFQDFEKTAIRITDNQSLNYNNDPNPENWSKSNPFGYAAWFQQCSITNEERMVFLSESIEPLPSYNGKKSPLQRAVQILKRHRDMMYGNDEDRPISIIITTLASKAYNKETDIVHALVNIIQKMESYIEGKYSYKLNKTIPWVGNPVNEEENFADKWSEPGGEKKESNFRKWLSALKVGFLSPFEQESVSYLSESLSSSLGSELVEKSMKDYNLNSGIKSSASILTGTSASQLSTEMPVKPPTPKREGFQ